MLRKIIDGRTDLVFDYLAAGHAAASTDENGIPSIQWCAHHGDVSAVRFLLQGGESLESLGDNLDLNGAAFHGHLPLCQYLIENGTDVNQRLAGTGESPLHASLCKANRPKFEHVAAGFLRGSPTPTVA